MKNLIVRNPVRVAILKGLFQPKRCFINIGIAKLQTN